MKNHVHGLHSAGSVVALLSLLLAGCQTTGNPRDGGLFGWSEEMARERRAALESQNDAARKSAEGEMQRNAALSNKQGQLRAEYSELQAHLARLLTENGNLDAELRSLMSRRQLGAAELQRLRQTLATNQQTLADARKAAAVTASQQGAAQLSQHSQAVSQSNQGLHREVLLLMGR